MGSKQSTTVAITSIWSYIELMQTGQPLAERKKVMATLYNRPPLSSRELSSLTGIERTNITRVLSELVNSGIAEVANMNRCKVTGLKVKHYTLRPDLADR